MKTRPPGKIPREKAPVVQGFRTPARMDTTSEPQAGNDLPGAPVNAPMSGSTVALQPGWNRGMNNIIPPLILSGVGFFYYHTPNIKEGKIP